MTTLDLPGHGAVHVAVAPPGFDDWDALLALLRASFAYMEGRIDPPSSLDRMDAAALRAKSHDETLILATAAGRLVGCAFAAVRDEHVYVGKVAVAADARGQGVARALLSAADAVARQHGRIGLELQTRVELTENHRSFAALGFRPVAETAHPGYDRPTSITWQRPLADPQPATPGALA